jgi:hypothetical protein
MTVGAVSLLAAACAVSAGTIRHDVADSEYRSLSADPRYQAVGNLNWTENGINFSCTATLISPEWLLTGAHCVDGTNYNGAGITSMTFGLGDTSLFPTTTSDADQWIANPDWGATFGNLNFGNDIGLVHLATPITNVLPARLYTGSDEKGQTATFVGYGRTGTGLTGDFQATIFKRAGNQVFDNFGGETTSKGITLLGNNRILYTDFDSPTNATESKMGSSTPLPLEFMTANGDSGGGVFIQDPVTGKPVLAAVHSFGSTFDGNNNSDYGDASGSTRVSSFIDWITSYVTLPIDGDLNGDGFVGIEDLNIILSNWNQNVTAANLTADPSYDGFVGIEDLNTVLGNWNAGTPPPLDYFAAVPEPCALSLVGITGFLLFSKRR